VTSGAATSGSRPPTWRCRSGSLPATGIYADLPDPGEGGAPAAISLGRRPTFYERADAPLLEVHLLDFTGDLYGQEAGSGSSPASGARSASSWWRPSWSRWAGTATPARTLLGLIGPAWYPSGSGRRPDPFLKGKGASVAHADKATTTSTASTGPTPVPPGPAGPAAERINRLAGAPEGPQEGPSLPPWAC
jgi:hypothetical protein